MPTPKPGDEMYEKRMKEAAAQRAEGGKDATEAEKDGEMDATEAAKDDAEEGVKEAEKGDEGDSE
jgi:hypothetical protein